MLNIEKIETKSVKIALVVIISLLIGSLFKLYSPALIAINAVIAVQSTIYDSVSFGKDRVLGTVIGALVGIIIVTYLLHDVIITSIGIFLIIYACNLLNLKGSVAIAATVCLSIIFFPSPNYNALNVTISTIMGVFIAIIVNMLLSPFELIKNLNKSYYELKENIFFLYLKIFTANENIELEDFDSQVITFKTLVKSYNKEYIKIQDKKLKYEQIQTLYKNIDGINFFIASIIELEGNNLNDSNVRRVNNLLQLDLIALDCVENQYHSLFNFHVDKLLDYLEIIEEI
ncbi:FUSC family protein [Candidatus Clostridium stratigraminis]|uniref:FUSC family protein n=1 Tax=Candidatus Clostridium stratigraminis TaxID=3381661 RepID=A0ABW8T1D5_9CLOT